MKKRYSIDKLHHDIYRIRLPLPGNPPFMNTYLVTGEVNTLIDTGTHWSWRVLRKALKELALTFDDIHQVIITHGHVDHFGAAADIASHSKTPTAIVAHREDAERMRIGRYASMREMKKLAIMLGVPMKLYLPLAGLDLTFRSMGKRVVVNDIVHDDNETRKIGNYTGTLIHVPGHSQGSLCVHLKGIGTVFTGDHIVPHVKPIILAGFEPGSSFPIHKSQSQYHHSLEKILTLHPRAVYSGHGKEITDLNRLIKTYHKVYQLRKKRIESVLLKRDYTAYDLARKVFPKLRGLNLMLDLYLSLSETCTHLFEMVNEGDVIRYRIGKQWRFTIME